VPEGSSATARMIGNARSRRIETFGVFGSSPEITLPSRPVWGWTGAGSLTTEVSVAIGVPWSNGGRPSTQAKSRPPDDHRQLGLWAPHSQPTTVVNLCRFRRTRRRAGAPGGHGQAGVSYPVGLITPRQTMTWPMRWLVPRRLIQSSHPPTPRPGRARGRRSGEVMLPFHRRTGGPAGFCRAGGGHRGRRWG